MLFTSYQFILFVLVALILYYVVPKRIQWIVLLCMNMLFYVYAGLSGIIFIVTTIVTTYAGARLIYREKDRSVRFIEEHKCDISRDEKKKLKNISLRKQKMFLTIVLFINFGILAVLKYTNMFIVTFTTFNTVDFILPMGISFYTFQSIGYMIDVYRGVADAEKNPFRYALFVSFFPQLVAGPIVRARDFIPQIRQPLFVSSEMFGTGVFFIISGLFKKAVISDYISVNFVERIFDNPALYSGVENLFGVYGYALQIYCDFSGYSDMAIGLALLLGFRFPMNFNSPYKADSITDFWHRWHISLSTWLRDYLYISLGGNRKGKARTYINLCLTMLLGGLWHGASWNFVIWGGFHGIALAAQKFWRNLLHKPKTATSKGIRKFFAVLITFNFVCFCWIFFRNTTFEASVVMLKQIFTAFHPEVFMQLIEGYWKVFVLMGIGYLLHFAPDSWQDACCRGVVKLPLLGKALLLVVLIYLVIQIKSSDIQPFIYFQF